MTIRKAASYSTVFIVTISSIFYLGRPNTSLHIVEAASLQSITFPGQPTDRTPETYRGSFFDTTSSAMLDHLGVRIYPEDKVYAFPDPTLGLGSQLMVYRAQPVLLNDGTSQRLVRTWAPTVEDFLKEQHIDIGEKDVVAPAQSTLLTLQDSPDIITLTRVSETQIVTTEQIEYDVQYKDDNTLEKGTNSVEQKGINGTIEKTFLVHRENGVESSRTLLSQKTTQEMVPQIIHRGTKVTSYGSGAASFYGGVPALTAAHRTLPMGTRVKVINVDTGASVVVTIADRGPFIAGRIIDLSKDAFAQIAPLGQGVANVRLEKL